MLRVFGSTMSDKPTPDETCPVWMLLNCEDSTNKRGLVFGKALQTSEQPLVQCPVRAHPVHAQ